MVISDDLPGVQIELVVEGVALKEYEESEPEECERTVTRYVEAASGATFAIKASILPGFEFKGQCLELSFFTDGDWTDAIIIDKYDEDKSYLSEGMEGGEGSIYKYRFASIETVSDGRIKEKEVEKAAYLGTITVECSHVNILRELKKKKKIMKNKNKRNKVPEANAIISKKALKGRTVSHNVEFSEAEKVFDEGPTICKTRKVAGEYNPAALFKFHYRSLAALKSMLIIPRSPSPPPLEERDVTTLSADELRELQKRYLAMRGEKEAHNKVKRERADVNPRPRKQARPSAGDTQLVLDDNGSVRESSTATLAEREVIEID